MILTILLILMLCTAGIAAAMLIFKAPFRSTLGLILLCCLFTCVIWGGCTAGAANQAHRSLEALAADYEELTLYQNLVDESYNEYVRFDFYNRIQEYNEAYNKYVANCDSAWLNCFYTQTKLDNAGVAEISFYLHD